MRSYLRSQVTKFTETASTLIGYHVARYFSTYGKEKSFDSPTNDKQFTTETASTLIEPYRFSTPFQSIFAEQKYLMKSVSIL